MLKESKEEWFQKSIEEIENQFQVNEEQGLSNEQIIQNKNVYGTNELAAKRKKAYLSNFWNSSKTL